MQRVAVLSLHTSPLLQPGSGDSGGMNVYVRELVSALAQGGVQCTTYTRADRPGLPEVVQVEPGHQVVHVPAGPYDLAKEALPGVLDEFGTRVVEHLRGDFPADVVHANYWLSGVVAHRVKHELDLPFVSTFHTLAKVKAEGGDLEPLWRERAEHEIINCADTICVSCSEEERQFRRLYGDPTGRIEIVAPGVEHAFFAPGERHGARDALDLPHDAPVHPVRRAHPAAQGPRRRRARPGRAAPPGRAAADRRRVERRRRRRRARPAACADRRARRRTDQVRFVPPQPHHILSTYYRASDVVIVPSRSESFGLVALEASACGIPVVASAVGGLLTLVDHDDNGFLVPDRSPVEFARYVRKIIDDPVRAAAMGARGAVRSRRYTWALAAARLRRVYADLGARELVACA